MRAVAKLCLVLMALGFDVRTGRIPNKLCLLGTGVGILLRSREGLLGVADGFKGFFLAFFALCLPFAVRIIGAGDVKLFMALGMLEGAGVLRLIWRTLVLAGCYGALLLGIRILGSKEGLGAVFKRTGICLTIPMTLSVILSFLGV